MKIEQEIKLDFKDVLFRPKRSTLSSRSEVNLERNFTFRNSGRTWTGIPLISSNMDTVSSFEMFRELQNNKCITCFHKYIDIDNLISKWESGMSSEYFSLSTGITDKDFTHLKENYYKLVNAGIGVKFICIDVANGYMFKLIDFCKKVRGEFPNVTLIAGNVVSREMVEELIINGQVDIVKVGIGSGAVCTTRLQTGVGMPQLSAVMECADAAHGLGGMIISDGGACYPGDVAKAYGGGADFVMLGSMFAGHEECPGDVVEEDGNKFKLFYGMSSDTAMKKYHGGVAKYRSSEGKTVRVPFKGPVQDTINNILGGVRSTCTYVGASRLKDLNKCTTFVRVSKQVNDYYG
jgi:GMP reductase